MNGRKQQAANQINNYITPKRSSSKAKELSNKDHRSNVSIAGKIQNKLNIANNRQEAPYLPKHNIEQLNKLSDERYKEIKFVNLQINEDCLVNNKINSSSRPNLRKSSVDVSKQRPGTPKYQRSKFVSDSTFSDNYTSNKDSKKKNSNLKSDPIGRKKKIKFSKESAVIVIQRAFRIFSRNLKMNPKFEMSNLLKKKKLSILKNYKILNDDEQSSIGNFIDSDILPAYQSKYKNNLNYSKSLLKEEEKVTANFFGNSLQKKESPSDSKISIHKDAKESKQTTINKKKDNFIDDYESFLSYKKYLGNNDTNSNKSNKNDNMKEEKNLEKLKISLDKFTENLKKNTSTQPDSGHELNQFNIIPIAKDQTTISKQDISDTVNIYEKIFKEIKKDSNFFKDVPSLKKSKNVNSIEEKIEIINQDNENYNIEKEASFNTKNNCNQAKENTLLQSISDYKNSCLSIKQEIKNFEAHIQNSNKINYKTESDLNSENIKMIDRITEILEKEQKKSINYSNSINGEKEFDKESLNANQSDVNKYKAKNVFTLNKSLPISENKSLKDETQEKINKIHSILEAKETNEMSNRYANILKFAEDSDKLPLTQVNSHNTAEILSMVLELKESKKTTETMKSIIEELKKEIKSKEEFHKKELQDKLAVQKHEFDNIISRQNGIIEGLISEKKKLSQISDELNEKLDNFERINHKKIQQMIENFDIELKKNKDAWFQAEKIRRKKWEEQKLKEIKENTVKGLEPEIERILSSHKQELSRMEDRLTEDLRRQKEKLLNENERKISELKERFHKEKEEAIEHERVLSNQRMRNQNERLEEEFNEDRRRWNANLQAEINRLETLREKDKKLYDDQLVKIEERNVKLVEEKENYYKNKIAEIEKRLEDKLKFEEENYKLKYTKEKEKFIDEKQIEFEKKTKDLKNELIKDRDRQIQIIIEKLGDETINERKKIQIECERKADEINKNIKIENEQLKQKIGELSDKLGAESKVRLMLDDNLELLTRKLQEKERETAKKEKQLLELNSIHNEIDTKYSNLVKEFNKEKLDIELEYKGKLQKAEGEFKLLNEKLESLKSYYEGKINEIQSVHKNEINEIEDKIKKTFYRKDEVIKKLQEETQMKDITIQKYEELLAKQRKELLSAH